MNGRVLKTIPADNLCSQEELFEQLIDAKINHQFACSERRGDGRLEVFGQCDADEQRSQSKLFPMTRKAT